MADYFIISRSSCVIALPMDGDKRSRKDKEDNTRLFFSAILADSTTLLIPKWGPHLYLNYVSDLLRV